MKNFFKPTKVTWWMFGVVYGLLVFSSLDSIFNVFGFNLYSYSPWLFYQAGNLFLYFYPLILLAALVEVFMNPATIGAYATFNFWWFVIGIPYSYFISSIISFFWNKLRPQPKLPETS